jgi:hypothetical protein
MMGLLVLCTVPRRHATPPCRVAGSHPFSEWPDSASESVTWPDGALVPRRHATSLSAGAASSKLVGSWPRELILSCD